MYKLAVLRVASWSITLSAGIKLCVSRGEQGEQPHFISWGTEALKIKLLASGHLQ